MLEKTLIFTLCVSSAIALGTLEFTVSSSEPVQMSFTPFPQDKGESYDLFITPGQSGGVHVRVINSVFVEYQIDVTFNNSVITVGRTRELNSFEKDYVSTHEIKGVVISVGIVFNCDKNFYSPDCMTFCSNETLAVEDQACDKNGRNMCIYGESEPAKCIRKPNEHHVPPLLIDALIQLSCYILIVSFVLGGYLLYVICSEKRTEKVELVAAKQEEEAAAQAGQTTTTVVKFSELAARHDI